MRDTVTAKGRRGPKTPAGKRAALANLCEPWKPGQSGNPAGEHNAGATIRQWLNVMAFYSPAEVTAVLRDPKAPAAKVAAARCWRHATDDGVNGAGMPIAGADMDRIVEHTDGKAKQAVDLTSNGQTLKGYLNVDVDAV